MPAPIITFTSDFGLSDWFVGVVHGVIHGLCPDARVVDLTHDIPPGHVARAAFVLEAAARDFPAGVVHLAVVDPGVGTDRRALVVEARGQAFVGPDNGVLEWALGDALARVHAVTESRPFRQPVSRTFHARDVSHRNAPRARVASRSQASAPASPIRSASPARSRAAWRAGWRAGSCSSTTSATRSPT
jgi:S-adenosylmethionine hydrolase